MFHRASEILVRRLCLLLVLPALLTAMVTAQQPSPPSQPSAPPPALYSRQPPSQSAPPNSNQPDIPASRQPSVKGGHNADTNPGRQPHGSGNGGAIAAGVIGGVAAAAVITGLVAHEKNSPEHFWHNGPEVPKQFDMSGLTLKCLIGPNWPVVLDFLLDSPGAAEVEIVAADKHHFKVRMTNTPNQRAYAIFRLPKDFGTKTQIAVLQVRAVAPGNSTGGTSAPALRIYGMGGGENAVGSVAIDQLTFQPAAIHPKAKEVATYGFHAHSAFNSVRAEFICVSLQNGHVIVQQDQEAKLSPIPQGERARGTWEGKGKAGEHMLQVRAWRGLENGGDWVVAWSPDIVDVVK
jgi:hypothetical protein